MRNSCVDSAMEERKPIYMGVRGISAGMLAEHETLKSDRFATQSGLLSPFTGGTRLNF